MGSANDLDLFSGPRGWDVAAADLGLDPVGIELDDDACATSRAAGFRTVQGDVAALDPADFGLIRGLIASPPCQTFSAAGKGSGRAALDVVLRAVKEIGAGEWPAELLASTGDVRTGLVVQPLRYALALRPQWIAWEQVPTVLPVWHGCADVLEELGYHTWTGALHAEQYGVPQTRRRAFLLAHLDRPVGPPAPTHSRFYSRNPDKLDPGLLRWVSMAEAFGIAEPSEMVVRSSYGDGGYRKSRDRSIDEPAATVTCKTNYWAIRSSAQLHATVRGVDQPAPTITAGKDWRERTWVLRNNNQAKACTRSIDEPAGTLFFGGRSNWVAWQDEEHTVKITLEEAAALQTFPAGYPWRGTASKRFQQVGNAVPPLLARAVLRAVI